MILVPTLIKKLKRARKLLKANEAAFEELSDSASKEQVSLWSSSADKALRRSVKDPMAMDYFSLKVPEGEFFWNYSITA